jgi:hypothetical protein
MKLRKLAQMGLAEIASRSRQQANRWVDRMVPAIAGSPLPGGLATGAATWPDTSASFELFRDAAPRRFFPGVETGDAVEIIREELPSAARDVIAVANAICTRRFDLLGYEGLSFGETIDWHLDPVANRRAPLTHWSRIDPLNPAMVGDSKVTWELNRHQWLLPLAQAYWLTADRRYAQEAADLVDDWCRANPYGVGINWSSSLEVAFRLISWSWAFVLMRDAGVLTPREFSGLMIQVRRHALHIERYLSTYYSPNTHLTGEALGLFYAGVLFPEFPEAARWRKTGRQILIEEAGRQVYGDGVYFEQATCYQRYTVDFYLHFLILARRNDVAVPVEVRRTVEKMLEFLLALTGPDGQMPSIGDADGGWLLPLTRRDPADVRGTFAVAAAWFGRSDFYWPAGGPAPEVLWLLGAQGWDRLRALEPAPPAARPSVLFPEGGYAVMRSDWSNRAHQLIVDVGPLGCRVTGAHGHADLLGLQCSVFGEPCIVDPGTFCYTTDRGWRNHFRGTAAHSTVMVDGLPQAEPAGPFSWRDRPSVSIRHWSSTEEADLIDASHDAYASLPDPVRHRRRVLFVKPRFWVIVDDLTGRGEHDIDLRFQFAPGRVELRDGSWVAMAGKRAAGLWIGAFCAAPLSVRLVEGELDPPQGWISRQYGRRQPAPMGIWRTRSRVPARIVTLLLPVNGMGSTPPVVEFAPGGGEQPTTLLIPDANQLVRVTEETLVAIPLDKNGQERR